MKSTATTIAEPSDPELNALVRRAAERDRSAAQALFDRYADPVMGYCVLACDGEREPARDLVQTIFTRAFSRLDRLDDADRFEPWLWTIARREAARRGSKKTRYGEVLRLFQIDREVVWSEEDKVTRELRIEVVRKVLETVEDDELRQIVQMKYTEPEHTTREIAHALEIPHGTVTVKLMRFRDSIRNRLLKHLREFDLEPRV